MPSQNDNILTFTAVANNSSVQLNALGTPNPITLEYNLNGNGWLPYTIGEVISLPKIGNNVKMRGDNVSLSTDDINYYGFKIEGHIAASGDITSLQNKIGGDVALTESCYNTIFKGCTGLTTAPKLPSTTLASYCYNSMFYNCTGLTTAPILPATTIVSGCYRAMFNNCINIVSHDVATLDNSPHIFQGNTSCVLFIIHDDTPPAISDSAIVGLNADCRIYVPYSADHSILNAYKTAQYWSDRANYIVELDENGEIPE